MGCLRVITDTGADDAYYEQVEGRVARGEFAPEAVERGAETMHRRRELPQWGLRLSVRAGACGGGPAMIPVPTCGRVWLGTRVTDMRPPGDEQPVQART